MGKLLGQKISKIYVWILTQVTGKDTVITKVHTKLTIIQLISYSPMYNTYFTWIFTEIIEFVIYGT